MHDLLRRSTLAFFAISIATGSLASQSNPDPRTPDRDSIAQLPGLTILGTSDTRARIPGSGQTIERGELTQARVLSTNEALRKVSGIVVRDEEGLGLRPNIGIRGLNPTRSTKVLLLEDGVPVTIAPYGDNAAYYHPPVGRMDRIEVLKGAGQILYGPQTVGGVINYITPGLPSASGGTFRMTGGSNELLNGYVRAAAVHDAGGAVLDVGRWRGLGARENVASDVADASLKLFVPVGNGQRLVAKTNIFREGSQLTYSGLRESEWAANPRQNPFRNDRFDVTRIGGTLAHEWVRGPQRLTTTAYAHDVSRDWWRQSSNSAQRPNDSADPNCAGLANLESGCGNEGRLRRYHVLGIEPRFSQPLLVGSLAGTLDVGVRLHREVQLRRQLNGAAHDSRSGTVVEDNHRATDAIAAFVQTRLGTDRWSVSPGLRVEQIGISRTNRLPAGGNPSGVRGSTALSEIIPGIGATVTLDERLGLFAGVHRGFAPPRNEDIISNATGGVVELDAERSWNYEAGARWQPMAGWQVEATAFRMDFANQIVPASVAGGTGATLTSAGRTLHQGAELDVRGDLPAMGRVVPFVAVAATWVPVARYEGTRVAYIGTGGADVVGKVYAEQNGGGTRTLLSVTGNRLPYAPERTLTASLGLRHLSGFDVSVEAVHQGLQHGDPANTRVTVPDGQQGVLPATTLWNASVNWSPRPLGVTVFASVKNAFDALVLVDRTRGLLPAMGRVVLVGVERSF
jgi:Fe(3+) dicitrate transport protein